MREKLVDRGELVTCELDGDEPVTEGIFVAFDAIGYDLTDQNPPLSEFVAPHSLNTLRWENPNLCVVTSIWHYPVEITSDQITIYRPEDPPKDLTHPVVTGDSFQ